jgi:hypothetical protein
MVAQCVPAYAYLKHIFRVSVSLKVKIAATLSLYRRVAKRCRKVNGMAPITGLFKVLKCSYTVTLQELQIGVGRWRVWVQYRTCQIQKHLSRENATFLPPPLLHKTKTILVLTKKCALKQLRCRLHWLHF